MNNVIVNGTTGFIGRNLVNYMINKNVNVFVLSRDKEKTIDLFGDKVTIIEYDSENYPGINSDIINCQVDAFYNLAWEGVSPEHKNNINIQINNIFRSLHAAEFAKKVGCKLFISAGTVAEYVFSKDVMDLTEQQTPNDMYGAAKVSCHYFLDVYTRNNSLPFIWCIIPSAYGEGRENNNIITYTIKTLLENNEPVYGNLEQMWDFLYVEEISKALYLIGEKGISGKVYGIGSGVYKPLKDYITTIRNIINPNLKLRIGEVKQYSNQTFSSCVNITDLVNDTGFVPEIQFEEGIRKTIDWYKRKL